MTNTARWLVPLIVLVSGVVATPASAQQPERQLDRATADRMLRELQAELEATKAKVAQLEERMRELAAPLGQDQTRLAFSATAQMTRQFRSQLVELELERVQDEISENRRLLRELPSSFSSILIGTIGLDPQVAKTLNILRVTADELLRDELLLSPEEARMYEATRRQAKQTLHQLESELEELYALQRIVWRPEYGNINTVEEFDAALEWPGIRRSLGWRMLRIIAGRDPKILEDQERAVDALEDLATKYGWIEFGGAYALDLVEDMLEFQDSEVETPIPALQTPAEALPKNATDDELQEFLFGTTKGESGGGQGPQG